MIAHMTVCASMQQMVVTQDTNSNTASIN